MSPPAAVEGRNPTAVRCDQGVTGTMRTDKKFLVSIHYFRAFAILNIVAIHLWIVPARFGYPGARLIDTLREVLFHGSTMYFLFISGFLFCHLSPKFNLFTYYKRKFITVVCPYLFMSFVILFIQAIKDRTESPISFVRLFVRTALVGSAQDQYWYIPFIVSVFIVSPLLLKIPGPLLRRCTLVASLLPLLGSRTGTHLSFSQYVYFFPVYLIGMCAALDYSCCIAWVKKHTLLLTAGVIVSSVALLFLEGKSYRFGSIALVESLYYVQKIILCFLCLFLLTKIEKRDIPLLDSFATYSFAIYFTHSLVGNNYFSAWYYSQVFSKVPELLIPLSFLFVALVALANLLMCVLFKSLCGKQSRYFIGA